MLAPLRAFSECFSSSKIEPVLLRGGNQESQNGRLFPRKILRKAKCWTTAPGYFISDIK